MNLIFSKSLPKKGKPKRVFACLGLAERRSRKLPGIVLVNGGGGTAFREWVDKCTGCGYAAISIPVVG